MDRSLLPRLMLAVLLACAVPPAAGCDRLPAVIAALQGGGSQTTSGTAGTTSDTGTVEATGTPEHGPSEQIEVSSGRIYTPKKGTSVRTALMNAARGKFNTSKLFVVHQLYVQGDAAVGDIQPEGGGKRRFVAWVGPDWTVVWSVTSDSSDANAGKLYANVPQASTDLQGRLDFAYKPGPSTSQLKAGAVRAAKSWYAGLVAQSSQRGVRVVASNARIYRDGDGVWWVAVGVGSDPPMLEGTTAIMRYNGSKWKVFASEGSDGYSRSVPTSVLRGLHAPVY